jgi:uncharacterized protein YodC (DUF2158 family)
MTNIQNFPAIGFARGSIVRAKSGGPNMLVIRGYGDRTVVVVCEADGDGHVRLRDVATETLQMILPSQTPLSIDLTQERAS